ncbi:MAG: hypothetical protein Kow0037_22820 [Calditrichia bacterium]
MLDQVIENIIRKIQKEVVTPQMEQVPLSYLLTRNIPQSVKHFFDQEVELWLREEAQKFDSNERFDYNSPEIQVLIDKIFDILKNTATFHITKFHQLLERAVKLQANYLTRPHQTLTQFLFKDSQTVTTMEVYDMLKYFDRFQYYKDALTDYFNLKYMREINQSHFEELIASIDRQVYSKDPVMTILKTVKTVINFMNEGREPSDLIPLDVLVSMLKDRNLNKYAQLVQVQLNRGLEEISLGDLEVLLSTGELKLETEAAPAEVEDIEKAQVEVHVEDISVVAKPTAEPAEAEVEEEFEEEEEEEEEKEVAPKTTSAAEQLAEFVAQKIKGEHLEDLHKLTSKKLRKRFIKHLFKKDETRYVKFMDFLNELPTWKQASAAIDEMFYQAGVNPYSKDALAFTDLVYNRYFPKDRPLNREELM